MVVSREKSKGNCRCRVIIKLLVSNVLVAITAFNVGFTAKTNTCAECLPCNCPFSNNLDINIPARSTTTSDLKVNTITTTPTTNALLAGNKSNDDQQEKNHDSLDPSSNSPTNKVLPSTIGKVLVGMGRVNRDEFSKAFDVGVPLMPSSEGNEEVLILYGDHASMPSFESSLSTSSSAVPLYAVREATKNCLTLKMILLEPEEANQCVAIMGQWQAHMIHRWRRLIKAENVPLYEQDRASLDEPLQYVGRGFQRFLDAGVQDAFRSFAHYATYMNEAIQKLSPVAKAVVDGKKYNNTIIVTLCNHGQSELFINFVCAARARGIDTSQVLLFATDLETKELADALGIAAFYDETIFRDLPTEAAKVFGDRTFRQLIMTKVFCLHLIHQLGYNFLYQDADVLWYKHPLEYFSLPSIGDFDLYFQDDGGRGAQDEQYHANGGFFYVRNNKRTAYFFSNLIRYGEYIWKENEQSAINRLLNEHASITGLRAKILDRENGDFPGGWNFHRRPNLMKAIMKGDVVPYVFHMSWTGHKVEKRNYLEQMGLFFVTDICVGRKASEIDFVGANQSVGSVCCVSEPVISCHYGDKPSKIPCQDSPPMDKGAASFW